MSEAKTSSNPLRWISDTFGGLFGGETLDPKETVFISTLFTLLGSLARADGMVSAEEAAQGEEMIDRMQLGRSGRRLAVESFERGRAGGLDVNAELDQFLAVFPVSSTHSEQLLDALLALAKADGRLLIPERSWLIKVGGRLGLSPDELKSRL